MIGCTIIAPAGYESGTLQRLLEEALPLNFQQQLWCNTKVVNYKRMNMVTDGESEGFIIFTSMLHISRIIYCSIYNIYDHGLQKKRGQIMQTKHRSYTELRDFDPTLTNCSSDKWLVNYSSWLGSKVQSVNRICIEPHFRCNVGNHTRMCWTTEWVLMG